MDFDAFKEWVFLGLLTGGLYVVWQMKESINELNLKIAVIIEKIDTHEKRITKLEENTEEQ